MYDAVFNKIMFMSKSINDLTGNYKSCDQNKFQRLSNKISQLSSNLAEIRNAKSKIQCNSSMNKLAYEIFDLLEMKDQAELEVAIMEYSSLQDFANDNIDKYLDFVDKLDFDVLGGE